MKLLPWRIHFGFPLLRRELIGLLRTRRAFWLLLITVALSCLLPLFAWPSPGRSMLAWQANMQVFLTFSLTQLIVALLVIPAFTAGSISGERERGTYDLLYTTLLSPSSIVISKALASTGYVFLLLVGTAPAVCVLHLLGGFDFGTILASYAICFTAVTMSGLVCLAQSMRSRRTAQAVFRGVFWLLFYNGGLMLVLMLGLLLVSFGASPFFGAEEMVYVLLCMSPFGALSLEVQQTAQFQGLSLFAEPWVMFLIYAILVSSKQLFHLLRAVRTPEVPTSWIRTRLTVPGAPRPRHRVRRSLTAQWLIRAGELGVLFLRNPIFLKEIRSEFFARGAFRIPLFWAPLVLFLALGILVSELTQDYADWIVVVSMTTLGLLLLLVPGIAASSFPREIEQGNLDFLRGTLIPLRKVYSGKFLASVYSCSGIPLAAGTVLVAGFFLVLLDPRPSTSRHLGEWFFLLLHSGGVICMALVFTTAIASLASILFQRTLPALLLAYASLVVVNLVLPILLEIWLQGRDEEMAMGATNPFVCIGLQRIGHHYGRFSWELPCWFFGIHTAATLGLWLLSRWLVERLRTRDP